MLEMQVRGIQKDKKQLEGISMRDGGVFLLFKAYTPLKIKISPEKMVGR